MTLINFLTRVHFADGVLEEAIRSEMEQHGKRRPLIIAEASQLTGAVADRFYSSFPIRTMAESFAEVPRQATEDAARRIAETYRRQGCDLLIAFGDSRAMDLAKVARVAIAFDEPLAALSADEGGGQRITEGLADLYSVPGILGFASAISDYTRVQLDTGGQALLASRHLIPTVTICDPTLTLGATRRDTATGAAGVMARGVDAYLSPRYNPPAEGLALDAIARARMNVAAAMDDDLAARREMMAAALNSSMALQKGHCVVHAICNAIAAASPHRMDPSALGAVMIPRLVAFYEQEDGSGASRVKRALGADPGAPLAEALDAFIGELPLPHTLSDLGVRPEDLPAAAEAAMRDRAIGQGPRRMTERDVLATLTYAFGSKTAPEPAFHT